MNWENDGFIQKSLWQFVFSTLTEFEYGEVKTTVLKENPFKTILQEPTTNSTDITAPTGLKSRPHW